MAISRRYASVLCSLLTLAFLPASCLPRSTPPIAKIGLIAPFEGLYRRTGYELLAAMRAAVADARYSLADSPMEVFPKALNDSGNAPVALRAFAKLKVDPAVYAIFFPLTPWVGAVSVETGCAREPADASSRWFHVWLRDEQSSCVAARQLDSAFSIESMVAAIAGAAARQGAERLLVAGTSVALPTSAANPINQFGSMMDVGPTDALLWLGPPAAGANLYNQLRIHNDASAFWMGPLGGDPVFVEHATSHHRVYWAIWTDSNYNSWAESHNPSSPLAYLVYRQTERAFWYVVDSAKLSSAENEWQIAFFEVEENGQSQLYEP